MMRFTHTLLIVFSLFLISCNNNEAYFVFANTDSDLASTKGDVGSFTPDPNPLFFKDGSLIRSNYHVSTNISDLSLNNSDLPQNETSDISFYNDTNFYIDQSSKFSWTPQGVRIISSGNPDIPNRLIFKKTISSVTKTSTQNFVYSLYVKATHTFGVWIQIDPDYGTGDGCGFDSDGFEFKNSSERATLTRNIPEKQTDTNWYKISCYGLNSADVTTRSYTITLIFTSYSRELTPSPIFYSTGYQLELSTTTTPSVWNISRSTNLLSPP